MKQEKHLLDAPSNSEEGTPAAMSVDPFEACIPESPITQIINNHITNVNGRGGNPALEVGAAGTSVALNIAGTLLGL
jgi:hypothetical protein